MTLAFAAQTEGEGGKGILLSAEENVLLAIRGVVDSLRRGGNGVTIEALVEATTAIGAARSGCIEQSARATFELRRVKFQFQHSAAHSDRIEICFISD
jgi:hypothetical protein